MNLDSDFAITGEFEGTDPVMVLDPIVVYSADVETTITINNRY